MEIFEGNDSSIEDGSLLCDCEFGLNCGVASDKGMYIAWVYVCIDSRDVVGDAAGGEFVESNDIFIYILWAMFNFLLIYQLYFVNDP